MLAAILPHISVDLLEAEARRLLRISLARPLTPGEASDWYTIHTELANRH